MDGPASLSPPWHGHPEPDSPRHHTPEKAGGGDTLLLPINERRAPHMLATITRSANHAIDSLDQRTQLAQWILGAVIGMAWDEYAAWKVNRAIRRSF